MKKNEKKGEKNVNKFDIHELKKKTWIPEDKKSRKLSVVYGYIPIKDLSR